MMKYKLDFTDDALEDLKLLKRHEPAAYKKALKLIAELYVHPRVGTGHPEPLRGDRAGQWSRRITGKHSLIYTIEDEEIIVLVLNAYNHYNDK